MMTVSVRSTSLAYPAPTPKVFIGHAPSTLSRVGDWLLHAGESVAIGSAVGALFGVGLSFQLHTSLASGIGQGALACGLLTSGAVLLAGSMGVCGAMWRKII